MTEIFSLPVASSTIYSSPPAPPCECGNPLRSQSKESPGEKEKEDAAPGGGVPPWQSGTHNIRTFPSMTREGGAAGGWLGVESTDYRVIDISPAWVASRHDTLAI